MPAIETLFLLVLSILAMEPADFIRSLYRHFLSGITEKSLNAFYYACSYAKADYSKFMNTTDGIALKLIPEKLLPHPVFLCIDDTRKDHEIVIREQSDLQKHMQQEQDAYEKNISGLKQHEADALGSLRVLLQLAQDQAVLQVEKSYQEQLQRLKADKQAEVDKYQQKDFELLEQMKTQAAQNKKEKILAHKSMRESSLYFLCLLRFPHVCHKRTLREVLPERSFLTYQRCILI